MPRKKKIIVNTPQKEKFVPKEDEFVPKEDEFVPKEEDSLKQFGQKIRKARIAKNLSLESVSGHLHIAVKILEAIEEGDTEGPTAKNNVEEAPDEKAEAQIARMKTRRGSGADDSSDSDEESLETTEESESGSADSLSSSTL